MRLTHNFLRALLIFVLLGANLVFSADPSRSSETNRYEMRAVHDPNGIGKFYMGREIAHVMGHQAADWLERPEREQEERIDLLIDNMEIKPADVCADIGAGTGRLSFLMAAKVPQGKVLAEDIQPEMLEIIAKTAK